MTCCLPRTYLNRHFERREQPGDEVASLNSAWLLWYKASLTPFAWKCKVQLSSPIAARAKKLELIGTGLMGVGSTLLADVIGRLTVYPPAVGEIVATWFSEVL